MNLHRMIERARDRYDAMSQEQRSEAMAKAVAFRIGLVNRASIAGLGGVGVGDEIVIGGHSMIVVEEQNIIRDAMGSTWISFAIGVAGKFGAVSYRVEAHPDDDAHTGAATPFTTYGDIRHAQRPSITFTGCNFGNMSEEKIRAWILRALEEDSAVG